MDKKHESEKLNFTLSCFLLASPSTNTETPMDSCWSAFKAADHTNRNIKSHQIVRNEYQKYFYYGIIYSNKAETHERE